MGVFWGVWVGVGGFVGCKFVRVEVMEGGVYTDGVSGQLRMDFFFVDDLVDFELIWCDLVDLVNLIVGALEVVLSMMDVNDMISGGLEVIRVGV